MRAADGMLLEHNDTDEDGKVSLAEFTGNAETWIAALDTNADGTVTTADFGRGKGTGMGNN
jgi:hypothetical protein